MNSHIYASCGQVLLEWWWGSYHLLSVPQSSKYLWL